MVTFDRALAGTSADSWKADARLTATRELRLDGVRNLVVVAAHPDDESLGAGGLIAECASLGIRTLVVVVTDGAASHPDSPTVAPGDMAVRRAIEVREAIATLSPRAEVVLLGHADGSTRENRDAIVADLDRVVAFDSPDSILASTWRGDGHRDHRVVGELCASLASTRGVRHIEYPIWLWHWARPGDPEVPYAQLLRLPLSDFAAAAKVRAIAAHRSQLSSLSDASCDDAVLAPEFVEIFTTGTELYVEAVG
ncbi:MAG: PIG-L deacetylase family protein [Microbacteriaceae bacterium]